jgi:hypothetical protein
MCFPAAPENVTVHSVPATGKNPCKICFANGFLLFKLHIFPRNAQFGAFLSVNSNLKITFCGRPISGCLTFKLFGYRINCILCQGQFFASCEDAVAMGGGNREQ